MGMVLRRRMNVEEESRIRGGESETPVHSATTTATSDRKAIGFILRPKGSFSTSSELSFCHRPSTVACLDPKPINAIPAVARPLRIPMSSLHSCHWDWCRFTTVLHDDFVKHVVSTHLDKAEPVKRAEISLIHRVEQGASGHSGESVFILFVVDAS